MHKLFKFKPCVAIMCVQALLFTLIAANLAMAKDKKPLAWENVLRLSKGDSIFVQLFSKQLHHGKVDKVEPLSISLTTKEGSLLILKENIKSVGYVGRPRVASPGTWMILGGIALTVAGALGGSVKDIGDLKSGKLSGSTGNHGNGLMIAGLAIAAAGAPVLFVGGKVKTIYEAKAAPQATTRH